MDAINQALTDALAAATTAQGITEDAARAMVADIDAEVKQYRGSAVFVGLHGQVVHYSLILPPPLAKLVCDNPMENA